MASDPVGAGAEPVAMPFSPPPSWPGAGPVDPDNPIRAAVEAAERFVPPAAEGEGAGHPDDHPGDRSDGPPDDGDHDGPEDDLGPLAPGDGDGVDWDRVRLCAGEPETDIGNGRRFLIAHRDRALYVQRIGWHVNDGRRWAEDVEEALIRPLAHASAEAIALEAHVIGPTAREGEAIEDGQAAVGELNALLGAGGEQDGDTKRQVANLRARIAAGEAAARALKDRRQRRLRYAKTSGNKGKLDGMMHEAAPYVSRPVSDLDREPLALNVGNGTLRFVETGGEAAAGDKPARAGIWTLRRDPHRREDMISKLVPVDHDEAAECPLFEAFIETVLPDDEVRSFVQRYLGYALTALTREQVFCFFWGSGRNGKSTLVDLVCRIFGDYAATVPFETLAGDDRRKGSEATPDLARLPASRLVRASEPESKMQFREAMVKSLTSGEPILVRRLHQDFVEIYPAFKLVISGNHKPSIHGTDEGIWRRVLLVPFEVQIAPEAIDRRLPDKLWEERSGILNWLIAGTLSYLEEGLRIPDAVRSATQEYREESDPLGAFLREACEVTGRDEDMETPGDLHGGFKVYCEQAGFNVWGPSTFTRQLPLRAAAFGFRKAKTMGMSVYRGIRIKDAFRPPSHTHGSGSDPGWTPDR